MSDRREFPVRCDVCGKSIETRHGIGLRESGDERETIFCLMCHRTMTTDRLREPGPVRAMMLPADSVTPQLSSGSLAAYPKLGVVTDTRPTAITKNKSIVDVAERPSSPAVRKFLAHVEECFSRGLLFREFTSDKSFDCSIEPLASPQAKRKPASLPELDSSTTQTAPLPSVQRYRIVDSNGTRHGIISIVVIDPGMDELESGVTVEFLNRLLANGAETAAGLHHYLFCCTENSMAEKQIAHMISDATAIDFPTRTSVYLHDLPTGKTQFRTSDIAAWSLSQLFQRASTSQQFLQALQWLQEQRPLAVCLSSPTVAAELGLEIDSVETAMRCLACQHDLHLDQLECSGLVVSERTTGAEMIQLPRRGLRSPQPSMLRRWASFVQQVKSYFLR